MQHQSCRKISVGAPDVAEGDRVFCFNIPVPEVQPQGAVVQILCAGVCYNRRSSVDKISPPPSPAIRGIRDSALFPGFEVAGVIDKLGVDVASDLDLRLGQRVMVYPYEGLPSLDNGYSEFISVPDASYLVKIPDNVPMHVAAMMPSGAVWAVNAVHNVLDLVDKCSNESGRTCHVLVVGTGGLALWTLLIAKHFLAAKGNKVKLSVAALKDDSLDVSAELEKWNVISWSEDVYESHLVERTKHVCGGAVDIVLDFGGTHRSLSRAIKCMRPKGVILVGEDSYDGAAQRLAENLVESQIELRPVTMGSLEQLKELVRLVSESKINSPPCDVFPVADLSSALEKLSQSSIKGRAVLEFKSSH